MAAINVEREILIAASATKLRSIIHEYTRELGTMLKARGVSTRETQKVILEMFSEGLKTLEKLREEAEQEN